MIKNIEGERKSAERNRGRGIEAARTSRENPKWHEGLRKSQRGEGGDEEPMEQVANMVGRAIHHRGRIERRLLLRSGYQICRSEG